MFGKLEWSLLTVKETFMAWNLRKYKYDGASETRPNATSTKSTADTHLATPALATVLTMDTEAVKADILSSLRKDISTVIRQELKTALADDFGALRADIKAVRSEIANNTTAIRTEIDRVKSDVRAVEDGLSTWTDEVVSLQSTVTDLRKEVDELKEKCEDMEGRMRRGNIRIMGVAETPGSSAPTAVSKLLKEVLQMDKEVQIERAHRSLTQRKPGDKPRIIIAKLHNEGDAMDILRKARERGGQLRYNGNPIAIFPDYTAAVAKARAAFTDVRKMLRGKPGIRYGLLFPARLRISHNNEEKEFVDVSKAMDYVKRNIIPMTTE